MTPRILFFDIETSPLLISAWGVHDVSAIEIRRDWFMLSFAYQWYGDRKIIVKALPDYPGYYKDRENDKKLSADLHKLFCEADYAIAHNGDKFDIKKVMARLVFHGLSPPSPFVQYDTLKAMRRTFAFSSNRLDSAARYLGIGRKLPHTGKDLWRGCEDGDPKSWSLMRRYNKHDVWLLQQVYERIKAYDKSHPDMTALRDTPGCPTCASVNIHRRGSIATSKLRYQRYQCQDCGHWFRGTRERVGECSQ